MQWCRRRDCRGYECTPKSFDLLKIWAKSLKIWAKPLKIWVKSLKIQEKWCPALFNFKKWRPTFAEKHN